MHQFEIHKILECSIGGVDVSFTNSSLYMVLTTVLICLFLHLSTKRKGLIPSKKQSICELLFEFVCNIVKTEVGKDGLKYVPYIFSLFLFILVANLIGILPYAFTVTSHIVVTFTLAMLVFIGITLVGLIKHRMKFFCIFKPKDVPIFITPILIPVEIISYFARPISLSMRLFANMVAGHVLLKIVAGAAVACAVNSILAIAILPIGVSMILTVFELFVSVLQAYVFTILSCIYLNSVIHMH